MKGGMRESEKKKKIWNDQFAINNSFSFSQYTGLVMMAFIFFPLPPSPPLSLFAPSTTTKKKIIFLFFFLLPDGIFSFLHLPSFRSISSHCFIFSSLLSSFLCAGENEGKQTTFSQSKDGADGWIWLLWWSVRNVPSLLFFFFIDYYAHSLFYATSLE